MNDIVSWINGQPVWAQVLIALVAFFILLPAALLGLASLVGAVHTSVSSVLRALADFRAAVGVDVAVLAIVGAVVYGVWLFAAQVGPYIAFQFVHPFGLSPARFETLGRWLTAILFVLLDAAVAGAAYAFIPWFRDFIKSRIKEALHGLDQNR